MEIKLLLFIFLSIRCCLSSESVKSSASVIFNQRNGEFEIHNGFVEDCLVFGEFLNSVNETGWGELSIRTINRGNWNDSVLAYGAGLVEGYLTKDLIEMHWLNTQSTYCTQPYSDYCTKLHWFLTENLEWIKDMINDATLQDTYWYQVKLHYEQISGLLAGYHNKPGDIGINIEIFGHYLMQIQDDIYDIENVLKKPGVEKTRPMGHCSALVKLLENGDVLSAHDTWSGFNTMLRILKYYDLPFHTTADMKEIIHGSRMSFSSYPGYLYSSDDFYVTSAQLMIMETTNPTNNNSLFNDIKPEGIIFEGIRNQIANRLASTGYEWVQAFSRYNSGTYNNQWMVVNYKQLTSSPPVGILTVLEQYPGLIHHEDLTPILMKKGYWSSFNRIYYRDIFAISGEQELIDKYGDFFTHDKYARALIFDRDQQYVENVTGLVRLMRYNDYKHDPLSRCNCTPPYSANLAIMARGDLNPADGAYPFHELGRNIGGGLDTKATSSSLVKEVSFYAQSGPTSDQVPVFKWSDVPEQISHLGHPDTFNFPLILFNTTKYD
ncbi:hypothetical protein LOTGIDRAFT_223334 [Lottia gigantea]|uniref:Phospholipase B-like n=1 Tax=Lottia gigantea TaxID=225164 RepID=V3ZJ98_LOTGI|nr:hypothetical protein LOTGIDRAFT_223334 [Lottia gigantea]ESO82430.1 hypothetical protein LOTGIDRAFT_223334 [Lottia gigantea]